ncbi:biosynthetic-type acetolactate synthase large subunit [Acetivibrio mesophilus]|uniref:Acetolactate synthase n=1 Tax=Acetivibrio mesophilus TaxID=2487273 RepID=A0A4Q0I519_9FIRM|nr:biosynthetic-type acetolactate synthase large subunit [Acetivibrio mesophilus]ODM27250.1 acetolactate synthase, large subunit, biosynthetic type [Clostridium sp. Bc-iso-3]RXE58052.1 biosynthetic-type acetolactate synthase large subunit [Acetivibrio mesophilus]HHV29787.1 biosynthetic-type acetolactate synthase large subunit [Clostridium sp.]
MKLSGAQAIVKALELEGVEVVFGYPGAAICPFYDALMESNINHILTRHEQGAAHAASGYARTTGRVGVCVATSGPGATNLITGIADAYMDSIPLVAITGQVNSELIGRDVFQEADITGATDPFCKHNYLVKNTKDLPRVLKEAFYIASTGRPGPVLIDVPIDVQTREINFEYPESVDIKGYKPNFKGHSLQIKKIAEAIEKAKRPVICAGGGVINSDASQQLFELSQKCGIPVVTTLMGIGAVPYDYELNLGMVGTYGVYTANYAVNNADLLIIIGARVADRAISNPQQIAKKKKIVHIDIDPAEIGKNIEVAIPVVGDVKQVLEEVVNISRKGDTDDWVKTIQREKSEHAPKLDSRSGTGFVNPKYLLSVLTELLGDDDIVTTEVGQNQIWAANYLGVRKPRTFISSGGLGTMGYGFPAAVGAKIGSPDCKVVCVEGDGSFQMNMQELGTIKQNKLGIKVILFNNSRLGMVRELQKSKYCGRYFQVFLEDNPDFIKLFDAYGFKGRRIDDNSQVEDALKEMLSDEGAYLLECRIDPEESTL